MENFRYVNCDVWDRSANLENYIASEKGHRIKTPKLTFLVSSCWEKNFIRNNAHNFLILSLIFLKLLIVSVAFFLGHSGRDVSWPTFERTWCLMIEFILQEMRDDETGRCSRSKSLQFIHRAFGHWPSSGSSVFPYIQYNSRVVAMSESNVSSHHLSFLAIYIHWASKETYHFFRATPTKIHVIKINICTQISFNTP